MKSGSYSQLRPCYIVLSIILLTQPFSLSAQNQEASHAIFSGIPWFDEKGNVVSAHGGCVVQDKGKYYFFGERHTDTSNAFAGFNCYSSVDLYNWKFESIALSVQDTGKLGKKYVGERVKVMRCSKTGEYVMYMHADTLGYKDQFVGYATSNTISGPYNFRGALLFKGKPIRKWDIGTFQDKDGSGYVLIHGGEIYKLSDDYKSVTEQVNKNMTQGFEAPTVFRKGNTYYFLGSNLTSWEKNDNYYYTATSLAGPWTSRGIFCPSGTLTWNSQVTFIFPIVSGKDTTYMFMGDRWSFPKQASAATYVWQPITVSDTSIFIPTYLEAWNINTVTGKFSPVKIDKRTIENTDNKFVSYAGKWQHDTLSTISADEKGASFSVKFNGTQVGCYGLTRPNGGYAAVLLQDSRGQTVLSSIVDMYSKYPVQALVFLSPVYPKDNYTLTVTVMGEKGNWSDKRKSLYGSTGYFISLDKVIVNE
jgi:hypothetical protein